MERASEEKLKDRTEIIVDHSRVMNFSDAVFAFAATLLVLKIDLPALNGVSLDTHLPGALFALWPQYLANFITFFVIGFYWLEHHGIFAYIKRFNRTVVWINMLLLISVSFLPFPVDLYGDHNNIPFVVAFFSASLAMVGYLHLFIWIYASAGHRLIDKDVEQSRINYYTAKYAVAPIVFTAAIPLSFIHPLIAQFSWIFVILGVVYINSRNKNKKFESDTIIID